MSDTDTTKNKYDVAVIGSGPAGGSIVSRACQAGLKVAVIDKRWGGTCAVYGCTPKKAMETITELYYKAKLLQGFGWNDKPEPIDWPTLMRNKQQFTELTPMNTVIQFESQGAACYEGEAEFVDAHTLQVGEETVTADNIVIATGARPRIPDVKGKEHLRVSDDFFELERLPRRVAFIGGGYVAFELSMIARAAGREVTILNDDKQPLSHFESDHVAELCKFVVGQGIDLRLGYDVGRVDKQGDSYAIETTSYGGQSVTFEADVVFATAGRIPNVDRIGMGKLGVELDDKGTPPLDDHLRVEGQPHIYVAGDAIGKLPFTPAAVYEAEVVGDNLIEDADHKVDHQAFAKVVHTLPALGAVGLLEREAREQDEDFEVYSGELKGKFSHRRFHLDYGAYKILTDRKQRIIGAHFMGENAHELVNYFTLAMRHGLTVEQLKKTAYGYPTAGSEVSTMLAEPDE